ncbi:MAG: GNAT family N-acetyltransferase [Hyphomicrobiaceae bacterium]|nr:GNAT family N-acetyltransferase [Hyphomicrobiaceae bacterium]
MKLPTGFSIGQMHEDEVATLGDWAAAEGWNPGLSDLRIAWETDPEAFVALRKGSDLTGGGSIFSYGGGFGFMGLFIMRADLRRQGLGAALWHWRRDRLIARLKPGAAIAMDGVLDMVPFYERGGFRRAFRDVRFEGIANGAPDPAVVALGSRDHAEISAYDQAFVPASRDAFLSRWIAAPGVIALGARAAGQLIGYGVARPCRIGFKIGPLLAESPDIAERIALSLMSRFAGQQVQIDLPEANPAAVTLAGRLGLAMSFACMRLYYGPPPALPIERTFAVTTLEFG